MEESEPLKRLLSFSSRHVDTNSKNVFGQPRLRASLRDLRSPRRTYKSTIEDDLKKLIIMDSPGDTPQRDPVRTLTPSTRCQFGCDELFSSTFPRPPSQSPRRPLQRTFSDESLCSGRREASFANSDDPGTPGDVLFTATLPTRRHGLSNQMQAKKSESRPSDSVPSCVRGSLTEAVWLPVPLSASELSLTEVRDKVPPLRRLDPGLMPLPDTAGGLEWSSLVSAAKAYEGEAGEQPSGSALLPMESKFPRFRRSTKSRFSLHADGAAGGRRGRASAHQSRPVPHPSDASDHAHLRRVRSPRQIQRANPSRARLECGLFFLFFFCFPAGTRCPTSCPLGSTTWK